MTRALLVGLSVFASACSGAGADYAIDFVAEVGGQPFSCGQSYAGIGTTASTITPQDLRMYVHDLALVRENGERQALTLVDDGEWQHDGLALVDFEDGTGGCDTASPATHTRVAATAPAHDDYDTLELTLGVPESLNHLSVVTASAPLNQPALYWSWVGGFKYVKAEVASTKNAAWLFHLAAQRCASGGDGGAVTCALPNLAKIRLAGYVPGKSKVVLDLAQLYAGSDLDAQSTVDDRIVGCMSSDGDAECVPMFAELGLPFDGVGTAPAQRAFSVR